VCFEKFLELFAAAYPDDLHIIQLAGLKQKISAK